jgi:hypothetical protein
VERRSNGTSQERMASFIATLSFKILVTIRCVNEILRKVRWAKDVSVKCTLASWTVQTMDFFQSFERIETDMVRLNADDIA